MSFPGVEGNPGLVLNGGTVIAGDDQTFSIGVQFAVRDPTGTNVTTFAIPRSTSCTNWTDYTTLTVTGNYPVTDLGSAEISDFVTSATPFYRMRLINF